MVYRLGVTSKNSSNTIRNIEPIRNNYKNKEVILNLNIPIFQKGAEYTGYKKARHSANFAEQQLLNTQKVKRSEAVTVWNNYKNFISVLKSDMEAIKVSELALESLRTEVKSGTRPITDLLDEQKRFLDVKERYRRNIATQRMNIYKAQHLMNALDLANASVKDVKFDDSEQKQQLKDGDEFIHSN